MTLDSFFEKFELFAEAPNAVAKMRELILDLAVKGSLTAQHSQDEPATSLLEKLSNKDVVVLGKRGTKKSAQIGVGTPPYSLPNGWCWASVSDLASVVTSGSRDWAEYYSDHGAIFVRMGNLSRGSYRLRLDKIQHVNPPKTSDGTRTRLEEGDILISITGEVGLLGLIPENFGEAYINQHTCLVRLHSVLRNRYLAEFFRSPYAQMQFNEPQRGLKNSFRLSDVTSLLVPLPPLAEQKRIVAKVDELMALCDRLEAQQKERETRHTALVQASLTRFTDAPTPTNLEFLFQKSYAVEPAELRKTILTLAVQGRLLPQDPSEEDASAMVARALRFREKTIRDKQLRKKQIDQQTDLLRASDLPGNWHIERLANLVDPENTISYGVLVPGNDVIDGVPFVRAQDLCVKGHPVRPNKTIAPEIERPYARTRLVGGEILLCVVGSIGKIGTVPESWAGANIARAVARIKPIIELDRDYLLIVLQESSVQSYFTSTTRTLAQPTLNVSLIEQTPVPVPPLPEQKRIVAKVEELMGLVDRLEALLSESRERAARLMDAVVAEIARAA